MPAGYNEQRLKEETEAYWEELRSNAENPQLVWRKYVTGLLPQEMEAIRVAGKSPPEDEDRCLTLVLLVGHSIEPLLQSVWAYRPQELLLILNEWYGDEAGEDFAIGLCDLLSRLPAERQIPKDCIHQEVVQPTPANVFRALVERVRDREKHVRGREKVVVDITGAKKSMVTGAFLYAAYANVPISYVDFNDKTYNTGYGKPYGYDSHIHLLENPYAVFALRDWERVHQLYNSYHFREAGKLLEEEIIPVMEEPYFKTEHILAAERLVTVLHCYELWDSGDIHAAREQAKSVRSPGIEFNAPTAVGVLGAVWPHAPDKLAAQEAADELLKGCKSLTRGDGVPRNSIFCCDDWLLVYAEDEIERIGRLIDYNEDYRSALLRAASLNEMLLKARLSHLWHDEKLVVPQGQSLFSFDALVERAAAGRMLQVLMGKQRVPLVHGTKVSLAPDVEKLNSFWDGCPIDLETVIELRNKTVHTYLSVPRSVAEGAADVAQRNLDDYREHRAVGPLPDVVVHALEWRELCELCGADAFLPPPTY